jgi:hypothetical protein
MNEKINGLWDKAVTLVEQEPDGDWSLDTIKDKFAELIVEECIGVVEGGRFLHDQAPTALFAKECSGAIKRHFGVEE